MDLLEPILVLLVLPILSVGPAFLLGGCLFHRLVPRSSQKQLGISWYLLGILLGPILSSGLDIKSLWTMPFRGSVLGLTLAPLFGWYLSQTRQLPECSEPGPIGSL